MWLYTYVFHGFGQNLAALSNGLVIGLCLSDTCNYTVTYSNQWLTKRTVKEHNGSSMKKQVLHKTCHETLPLFDSYGIPPICPDTLCMIGLQALLTLQNCIWINDTFLFGSPPNIFQNT